MFRLQISSFSFNFFFYSPFAVRSVYSNFNLHTCMSAALRSSAKLQQFFMRSRFVVLWFIPSPPQKKNTIWMRYRKRVIPNPTKQIELHSFDLGTIESARVLSSHWCFCFCLHVNSQENRSVNWMNWWKLAFLPIYRWPTMMEYFCVARNADPIRFGYLLYIFVCVLRTNSFLAIVWLV